MTTFFIIIIILLISVAYLRNLAHGVEGGCIIEAPIFNHMVVFSPTKHL